MFLIFYGKLVIPRFSSPIVVIALSLVSSITISLPSRYHSDVSPKGTSYFLTLNSAFFTTSILTTFDTLTTFSV